MEAFLIGSEMPGLTTIRSGASTYPAVTAFNWLLIVLTLGLYWPWAQVRLARLRLQAVSVDIDGDVNAWLARTQAVRGGVVGDAAGDFFGLDMAL